MDLIGWEKIFVIILIKGGLIRQNFSTPYLIKLTIVHILQHGFSKVDGLVGTGPDDLSTALVEHPGTSGLVVSSGRLVNPVKSILDCHL